MTVINRRYRRRMLTVTLMMINRTKIEMLMILMTGLMTSDNDKEDRKMMVITITMMVRMKNLNADDTNVWIDE